ncbi:hypothetical protein H4R33_006973, partial [Dimargaris cristalligena]
MLNSLDETAISAEDYNGTIEAAQQALGELQTYTTQSSIAFPHLQVWITLLQADSYWAYEAILALNSDSLPVQLGFTTVLNSQGQFAQLVTLLHTFMEWDPDNQLALAKL